jgi:transcriptional regulator with XRE-family HTH domain
MRDRSSLISKLVNSRKSRESYIRSKLNVLLPSQLRGLRLRREMKQDELGREAEMKQSRISAMERPGEASFNIETLIRLAAALRVGLKVEFVPFSEMLTWENSFSQDRFNPVPIERDTTFIDPAAASHGEYQEMLGSSRPAGNDLAGGGAMVLNASEGSRRPIQNEQSATGSSLAVGE